MNIITFRCDACEKGVTSPTTREQHDIKHDAREKKEEDFAVFSLIAKVTYSNISIVYINLCFRETSI